MNELLTQPSPKMLEKLLIDGDLSSLNAAERLDYYAKVCESLGLNPLTKPFAYIKLNGKLVLYALKNCAEQLRKIHGVSVYDMRGEMLGDAYIVTAGFRDKSGRTDQATGAVPIKGLTGEAYTNAMLKAETKCKNRGTYSLCGLGMLDETEVDSIPGAEKEAAEKFRPLRVVEEPSSEQLALEATIPEPDPEPAVPRLNRYYGKLRGLAIGKTDYDNINAWVHRRMNEEMQVKSLAETTDEQLDEIMRWLAVAEKTRAQVGKRG